MVASGVLFGREGEIEDLGERVSKGSILAHKWAATKILVQYFWAR
jgi:hypothetical protein